MKVFTTSSVLLFLTFILPPYLHSQSNLNMTLQDSMDYAAGVNDVWGWTAPDGSEYALVGLDNGVSIVNVDVTPVKEVVFVPGVTNLWRDINTFGHYAYVSSEARVGLLIIDLQYLPDSVETYIWSDSLPTASGKTPFEKAHTLFTDENGILYLNGTNVNSGGVVMVDIKTNPTDPIFLGYAPAIYSHDVYARDSILYSAEIYAGDLSIYDISDPQNVVTLGRVKTPNEFTHNAWLSDDSRYLYTTDERANSYVAAYDIQDPANIIEVDRFRQAATDGLGSIPHNVFVWNDFIVVAYYTNGTLIVDASRPDNLVEVGNFDSWLGGHGGFDGVWGAYPFLPSGKILASDRSSGLFVFVPNYVRAAFLEGSVIDSITKLPLQGATITILSEEIVLPQTSKIDGTFKTGKAVPGTFNIRVQKVGYREKIVPGIFVNGEVLTPTIELSPLPVHEFSGKVLDHNGLPVEGAKVSVQGYHGVFEAITDANGDFFINTIYQAEYEVQGGFWGLTASQFLLNLTQAEYVILQLDRGYEDDFDLDLGWTISGFVTEGEWARGIPREQRLFSNWLCGSGTDSPDDTGSNVYSTGLGSTPNAQSDEVSGGTTFLTSPSMDFSSFISPRISFDYWLCEFPPNQYVGFTVWIATPVDTMLLAEFTNDSTYGTWMNFSVDFPFSMLGNDVRIIFSARDTTEGSGDYYLKVHVDNFKVIEGYVGVEDEYGQSDRFQIYPNPLTGDQMYLKPDHTIEGEQININIHDLQGRLVTRYDLSTTQGENGIRHQLEHGMYILQWNTNAGESGVEKIIVVK